MLRSGSTAHGIVVWWLLTCIKSAYSNFLRSMTRKDICEHMAVSQLSMLPCLAKLDSMHKICSIFAQVFPFSCGWAQFGNKTDESLETAEELTSSHWQCCQGVLENLLKAQELDDGKGHCRMESATYRFLVRWSLNANWYSFLLYWLWWILIESSCRDARLGVCWALLLCFQWSWLHLKVGHRIKASKEVGPLKITCKMSCWPGEVM